MISLLCILTFKNSQKNIRTLNRTAAYFRSIHHDRQKNPQQPAVSWYLCEFILFLLYNESTSNDAHRYDVQGLNIKESGLQQCDLHVHKNKQTKIDIFYLCGLRVLITLYLTTPKFKKATSRIKDARQKSTQSNRSTVE